MSIPDVTPGTGKRLIDGLLLLTEKFAGDRVTLEWRGVEWLYCIHNLGTGFTHEMPVLHVIPQTRGPFSEQLVAMFEHATTKKDPNEIQGIPPRTS